MGHNCSVPRLPAPLLSAIRCAALVACLAAAVHAGAQEAATAAEEAAAELPATGDGWLDRHLLDIDRYAERHPRGFADELSRYYGIPRAYVEAMLKQPGWRPGDVFMACALARRLELSCREVVRERARDASGGWAGVAERMGLDPDSTEHRQLRLDVEASYRRWARPLLDG